ncbi:unnamed protein product [Ambrosiozyma monospora]|uniref:Unnamed protein product n=1 Tax=Ambrosiozyma monospora TaxID=43982 RepID=A0ACB5TTW4_AMBMO|nr:unnamed protein product [Ambrosiozyma monospora]
MTVEAAVVKWTGSSSQWAVSGVDGSTFSDSGDTSWDSGFRTLVVSTRSDGNQSGGDIVVSLSFSDNGSRNSWSVSFSGGQWAVCGIDGGTFSDGSDTSLDSGFRTLVVSTRSDGNKGGRFSGLGNVNRGWSRTVVRTRSSGRGSTRGSTRSRFGSRFRARSGGRGR